MALEPGTRIGPYEIVGLLGGGGMGEVYKGHDPRLGRDVAIKVVLGKFAPTPKDSVASKRRPAPRPRLSHPNIVSIYDVGAAEGMPYLVSECCRDRRSRALLRGRDCFARTLDIARQMAAGLTAAHARDIAHRDLKPENIFLTAAAA